MTKTVCIHGHFYQPPRENPWTGKIDNQISAAPYQDWNKRIYAECYARNSKAPILEDSGVVAKYVNNYEYMSFDFGPTLLRWSEIAEPELAGILREAERKSAYYSSGCGNGVAQAYHHLILPLAAEDDRNIEVHWGIKEFEYRFGRTPKGMWLPETAVDIASLESLVDAGILFTILAPNQISAIQSPTGDWQEVSSGSGFSKRRPYLVELPSGRNIAVFVYDGDISHGIAFGGLLDDGERFAGAIVEQFDESSEDEQIVLVATDGESYGHHHRYGEMALAKCISELNDVSDVQIENCEAFLERCPPSWKAKIVAPSAWSCAHGVERWVSDCGCAINPNASWNQAWRGPMRKAFEWLRSELLTAVSKSEFKFTRGLHEAQMGYVKVVLDPSMTNDFVREHCPESLDNSEHVIEIMEMLRFARAMFTSCAWFFDDVSGIEARQNLLYARRAIEIAEERFGASLESGFLKKLSLAKSNVEDLVDGERVYNKSVTEAQEALTRHLNDASVDPVEDLTYQNRSAGVLLHPTSLPGSFGIGTLGLEAYRFVDWLSEAGFQWWQILPLVPPAKGGSPYSSWSTFASNPLLICLETLQSEGLLEQVPAEASTGAQIDFDRVHTHKWPLLKQAAIKLIETPEHPWFEGLQDFKIDAEWLTEAALFDAIKNSRNGDCWWEWPGELKSRKPAAMKAARKELQGDLDIFVTIQYFFERQWEQLRKYCSQKHIRIMGDVPIYVAHDSADVWANQALFLLDEEGQCLELAGAPPDAYSESGQLWGNPIYRWDVMEKNNFTWWKGRIKRTFEQVDLVRLDHFRGFAAYWSVPSTEDTALNGRWVPGPGARFFEELKSQWPDLPFVAEDLGLIDDEVDQLREQFELPGMRVLQFGFDANPSNVHAVHNVVPNSVVYTGTHDSDTLLGWWMNESDWCRDQVRQYFAIDGHDVVWDLIRAALGSVASIAIVQMQDLLALDSSGRMNRPGTVDGNWYWRLTKSVQEYGVSPRVRQLIKMYGRS